MPVTENLLQLDINELKDLMKLHGNEAVKKIEAYGGSNEICRKLQSDPVNGISGLPFDLNLRMHFYGTNYIPPKQSKSFLKLIWEAILDVTLIVLLVCAGVSILLTALVPTSTGSKGDVAAGWFEGIGIFMTVVIVVLVTAGCDYSKERQFIELQKRLQKEQKFSVVRGATIRQVATYKIVVGDICMIKYGDLLPTDGIVLQSNDLKMDESSLTGESDVVKKGEKTDPVVFSGTTVMEGSGKMLVTAVGVNSQAGIIMTLLRDADMSDDEEEQHSVLQVKLAAIAIQIGYAGLAIAILIVVILIVQYTLESFLVKNEQLGWGHLLILVDSIVVGITILVVAVPEGLPLAVTISLAFSVRKMMNDNNLVRHLDACETMGSATSICSDKTGTLTTNRMTVVRSYLCGRLSRRVPIYENLPPDVAKKLVEVMCVNSNYTSNLVKTYGRELPVQMGNKTECSLLGFVEELGKKYNIIRSDYPEESFVKVYTFNSTRKSMSTVVTLPGGGFRVYTKGASEIILEKCNFICEKYGEVHKLTPQMRQRIVQFVITPMSTNALRTLTLAYRDFVPSAAAPNDTLITQAPKWEDEEDVVQNLTLLCIVGIQDPVRPEVPKAIYDCQRAGITVRMVTGDNVNTATSIARQCGIIRNDDEDVLVLEGPEFNNRIRDKNGVVQQELLDAVWPNLRVLARSSPTDKYTLVKGIINSNISEEVVAVTGDGTNDAPALKKADVGFAMGLTGTDVAKQASDIILLDDNFSSMVKAVMWGRNVYDNICRFLQFQLTVNVVAVILAFIGACAVRASPLGAVQMLWVNLIMDTLASLALATDPPTLALLHRNPYPRHASLLTKPMLRAILGHAVYELVVVFAMLFFGELFLGVESGRGVRRPTTHFTMVFNAFVFMTLFNEVTCRKIHGERNVFAGIFSNAIFLFIWLVSLVVQIIIVQFGGYLFGCVALGPLQWLWCVAFGLGILLWHQVVVTIPTQSQPRVPYWQLEEFDAEAMALAYEWYPHMRRRFLSLRIFHLRGMKRVKEQTRIPDYRVSASNPKSKSILERHGSGPKGTLSY